MIRQWDRSLNGFHEIQNLIEKFVSFILAHDALAEIRFEKVLGSAASSTERCFENAPETLNPIGTNVEPR
jgi:hypothetical protein